ncbi:MULTISPECIES: DinB family protein [Micromonospora]|uniref:DinB family protein n=1 Tax=Micromonospora solifontis TaxID=2487138 RepID=A0ABX9WAP2_9ACTN|nr:MULTISPECIES: DinB family protein [Micromonospora]NES14008.1 DinB family protein [Micromonospora sp. PPF5-17B]NES38908.1 DinB family protein [Micromonospora solifontis]NES58801.1 DinB family protein [Micromonospora sp. PPF5-6]RNL92614.1 DinB family protein [Micromonospora solifontis]
MTWRAPEIDRRHEPYVADERTMLEGWLDFHRDTLLHKCTGLTAEQLKTASVDPSGLTLLGLVRHMADVERWWFRIRSAGEDLPGLYDADEDPDADLNAIADTDPAEALATYRAEVEAADRAVAGLPLDHTFRRRRRDGSTETRTISLRWVYVHMIEEYARHNGHADLIRERIDGVTGA